MSTLNNSSPGHDNINIKMFKNVIDYIITPLTYICNLSINKRPLGLTAPLSNCLCYANDI